MKNIVKGFAICFVLFIGLILYVLSHQIGGWRAFIVSSGSMEPAILTGSLLITHYTHPTTLQKNDVITFLPPVKNHDFVTHRIASITRKNNVTAIKTKGDSNKNQDSWLIAGGAVVGKVVYTIPYVGFLLSFTQTKIGVLFFILLPAIYVLIYECQEIIGMIRHHNKQNTPGATGAIAILFFLLAISASIPQSTTSILSDQVSLTNNHFVIDATSCQTKNTM